VEVKSGLVYMSIFVLYYLGMQLLWLRNFTLGSHAQNVQHVFSFSWGDDDYVGNECSNIKAEVLRWGGRLPEQLIGRGREWSASKELMLTACSQKLAIAREWADEYDCKASCKASLCGQPCFMLQSYWSAEAVTLHWCLARSNLAKATTIYCLAGFINYWWALLKFYQKAKVPNN